MTDQERKSSPRGKNNHLSPRRIVLFLIMEIVVSVSPPPPPNTSTIDRLLQKVCENGIRQIKQSWTRCLFYMVEFLCSQPIKDLLIFKVPRRIWAEKGNDPRELKAQTHILSEVKDSNSPMPSRPVQPPNPRSFVEGWCQHYQVCASPGGGPDKTKVSSSCP